MLPSPPKRNLCFEHLEYFFSLDDCVVVGIGNLTLWYDIESRRKQNDCT